MLSLDLAQPIAFSLFGRFVQEHRWEHNGRSLDVNLAVVVISGEAEFRFAGQAHPVRRGDVIVIPRQQYYTAHTAERCEYYFIHFNGVETLAPLDEAENAVNLETLSQTVPHPIVLPTQQTLGSRFEDVQSMLAACDLLCAANNYRSALLLQAQLTRVLVELAVFPSASVGRMPPLLERILRYIDSHVDEPIPLSRLSREFFVSEGYIARLFRKHLGTSSSKYVNTVKVRFAKQMLIEQDITLSQIAERLGFCDAFYFSKVFKQLEGVSPQVYAREAGQGGLS